MIPEHLPDKERAVETEANLQETPKKTQTSLTKIEEKPKVTLQTDEHALKQVDDKIPVQVHHNEAHLPNLRKGL